MGRGGVSKIIKRWSFMVDPVMKFKVSLSLIKYDLIEFI